MQEPQHHHPAPDWTGAKVYALCIAVFLTFLLLCGGSLWYHHNAAMMQGRSRVENLAYILSDHLRRSAEAVDATLAQLNLHSQRVGGPKADADAWMPVLGAALSGLPGVASLSILDAKGTITHSTVSGVVGQSRSNLYLFTHLAENGAADLTADTPFDGRVSGRMMIPLGRRLVDQSGQFLGIAVATLEPGRLREFYRSIDVGPNGVVRVLHPAGDVLFREPSLAASNSRPARAKEKFGGVPHSLLGGFLHGPLEHEGPSYLTAYRGSKKPPLVVAVSFAERDVLARWWAEATFVFILLLGVGCALSVAGYHFGREKLARAAADTRVAKTDAALKQEIEERRQLFETSPDLFLITDSQGNFVRVSPSSLPVLGYRPEEMVGRNGGEFVYSEDLEATRIEMQLARRGRAMRNFESRYVHKDGSTVTLSWSGVWSEPQQKHFFIGRDRTEQKAAEQALHAQNIRFDMAINNMSQGLCFFDGQQRLIVCNRRYIEMYRLDPRRVEPGITLRDIIDLRFAAGTFPAMSKEEYLAWRNNIAIANEASDTVVELKNGQTFEIHHRPMPDGGWVATHDDVTERCRIEAALESTNSELARQNAVLKEREDALLTQNFRFDTALANMPQGLCMFDSEQRLIVCNERYAHMFGLTRDEVTPGTTLRQILERRIANGAFSGESPEEYIAERLVVARRNLPAMDIREHADGRVIATNHQPMVDGGWVATIADISEQRRLETRLAHFAHHDMLTDLPNRVLLQERLEAALSLVQPGEHVTVLCLDLDRFKEVNDALGHALGDTLMKAVAGRLRECVRRSDTVARTGGDEFTIVQVLENPAEEAAALANRLIESITTPFHIDGHQVCIGTSIGIAVSPNDGTEPETLMRHADLALYKSKNDGRGTCRFFEPEMNVDVQVRRYFERDLRSAVALGQLELHYQPLVNLADDEVSGFEALLRWNHPIRGKVSPADFIPLAEETGLIGPIGDWVLRQACIDAATWPAHVKVAVNLSPMQFRSGALMGTVCQALAVSGLAAERLELEITESALLQDSQATLDVLRQLHDIGVRIALDDFGTGYSSLGYLRSFPFDKIKIDRCFISDLSSSKRESLAILHAVTELAGKLGMQTTAEGVETREQAAIVKAEGCTEMQGFFFCPPKTGAEIGRLFFSRCPVAVTAA